MTQIEIVLTVLLALAAGFAVVQQLRLAKLRRLHTRELGEQQARREAELREETARTSALFNRMVEGVIVLDPAGRIRLANRAAGSFFGFSPPSVGRTILEATRRHEMAALVARLDLETEILDYELRLDTVESSRFLQLNALALRTGSGARGGSILVIHDITRIRQLESMRQEFVANVSHELRTPLSLIKSAAETVLDSSQADRRITSRFLEIIERQANRLTFLIDDLLLLARLDSGRLELKPVALSLRDATAEAIDNVAAAAKERTVSIVNEVPAQLSVRADPDRFQQVLGNLIDNAIKYGAAPGTILIRAKELEGGSVELGIRDDGPGIAPEIQKRVFERFFRADKSRSREQGGTGLGLSIVKNVVQAHGGDVRLESAPGAGTEFFVTLPAAPIALVAEAPEREVG